MPESNALRSDVAIFLEGSEAFESGLQVLSAAEGLTDELAAHLLELIDLESSWNLINALHVCDFIIERNGEWSFAPEVRQYLLERLSERPQLFRAVHERLLQISRSPQLQSEFSAVPLYLAEGPGEAYHASALNPSEGLVKYAALALSSQPGQRWLGVRLAHEQQALGILPVQSLEVDFLQGIVYYREGNIEEAAPILRQISDVTADRVEVAIAVNIIKRIDTQQGKTRLAQSVPTVGRSHYGLPVPALTPAGNHFIVCGDNALAYRIALELTSRYGENVVVLLPDKLNNHGPQIVGLPGTTVYEYPGLTGQAFAAAGVASARAMALAGPDDLANFHAALRAQELNPDLRLVVAAYDKRLGDHISGFFRDCTVLSSGMIAAPSLVAAALGEPAPSYVRVSGRTLYVARNQDVPAGQAVCGLAVPDDPAGTAQLIPPAALPGAANSLVLAVADGTPRNSLARRHPPVHVALGALRLLAWNKFGLVFAALLAAVVAGFALLFTRYSLSHALYLTVVDMTGSALTNSALGGPQELSQVILAGVGMALLPLVTAIVVGARLTGRIRGEPRPRGGHVIVVGGGDIGTRVAGDLHDLGFDVVLIDQNPEARGVAFARNLRLPVIIGDAPSERVLRQAGVDSAMALVSATSTDIVNLATALQASAIRGGDLRIVLRMFDDDLAQRISQTLGNVVSQSVSYIAAPAFAEALLGHRVLRIIAVGRHVLMIADIQVEPGDSTAGQTVQELEQGGQARVLALRVRETQRFDWSPDHGHLLAAGDQAIVLATWAGLSRFHARQRAWNS